MSSLSNFDDVLALLVGDLEFFRHPVAELVHRFGERYRRDAVSIFGNLDRFARGQGESLEVALATYARYLRELARERRVFASSRQECGPRTMREDGPGARTYLYALTLSTVLARSRYEVALDYRVVLPRHAERGGRMLEVGAGNCLDAAFAASFGPVDAYELNPLSLAWRDLLGLGDRLRLTIGACDFAAAARYRFVTMIELLEHLADPGEALSRAHRALDDDGLAYLTFAIRMPQADHLYLFSSVDECRELLAEHGFVPIHEHCVVDTYMPYADDEKWRLAAETRLPVTYCCLTRKWTAGPDELVQGFNDGLEA